MVKSKFQDSDGNCGAYYTIILLTIIWQVEKASAYKTMHLEVQIQCAL